MKTAGWLEAHVPFQIRSWGSVRATAFQELQLARDVLGQCPDQGSQVPAGSARAFPRALGLTQRVTSGPTPRPPQMQSVHTARRPLHTRLDSQLCRAQGAASRSGRGTCTVTGSLRALALAWSSSSKQTCHQEPLKRFLFNPVK